jgi:Sigma-54 interaction domain/Bacterial regulatory protein, Fis family
VFWKVIRSKNVEPNWIVRRHAPMRAARMTTLAKMPTSRTISSTSAGSFGHVRGSFEAVRDRTGRFEAADDGTLFLDEVGEIPARIFADAACRRLTRRPLKLAPSDTQRLQLYDWPGNVRELQHVIERAVILSKGRSLELGPLEVRTPRRLPRQLLRDALRNHERVNIEAALRASGGRVSGLRGAAQLLGMKPTTLASRIQAWHAGGIGNLQGQDGWRGDCSSSRRDGRERCAAVPCTTIVPSKLQPIGPLARP